MSNAHKTRVNGALLGEHIGKNVMLIGEVSDASGNDAISVTASDGATVTVNFRDEYAKPEQMSKYIEVVCNVESDASVKALVSTNLGDSFDMGNYNEAVLLMQKFPAPFVAGP
eukprot:m.34506 g.34506  ORF g.34506 m.34506 type:complete len:113 (-) comp14312_c0_seq1:269-607(-)